MSLNIIREKVNADKLEIGMYVCELDRPWLETPYPLQGFTIVSDKDINKLQNICEFVYIDVKRTLENESNFSVRNESLAFSEKDKRHIHKVEYVDSRPMEEELPKAKTNFTAFFESTESLIKTLKKGERLDLKKFRSSTKQMIDSVIRNPDAALWLVRLKQSDDYLYLHSLRCSVLAVAFGRQLGLTKVQLNNLAIGAALMDIGKLKLPKTLLNRPGKLSDEEFEMIQDHVRLSLEMIVADDHESKAVMDMVLTHHERMNGKGYPNQLAGTDIPLFGRIAAIVDCYDAISTDRPYAKALAPAEAVKKLYEWKGIDFHPALVEVFIQALGIYPAGSLVELTTGQVGVVMSEYRTRRLRPKIMLILDNNKCLYDEFPTIDLFKEVRTEDGQAINIQRSLEPGSHGINPGELLLG